MQGFADHAKFFWSSSQAQWEAFEGFLVERGDGIRERFLNDHSGHNEKNGNEEDEEGKLAFSQCKLWHR